MNIAKRHIIQDRCLPYLTCWGKILLSLFLLFQLSTDLYAQAIPPYTDWMKTYDTRPREKTREIGYFVSPTRDSGYIAVGKAEKDTVSCGYIVKTDADGKRKWHRTFCIEEGNVVFNALGELSDGYIVSGSVQLPRTQKWHLVVARIDSTGNFLWDKVFGEAFPLEFVSTKVLVVDSCNFLVATGAARRIEGTEDLLPHFGLYIKMDQDGGVLWQNKIDGFAILNAYNTPDQGYFFCGANNHNAYPHAAVMETDFEGNILWQHTLWSRLRPFHVLRDREFVRIVHSRGFQHVHRRNPKRQLCSFADASPC